MKTLEGRIAIITGGASGMGEAIAKLFAKKGASVVLADLNEELLNKTVAGITNP